MSGGEGSTYSVGNQYKIDDESMSLASRDIIECHSVICLSKFHACLSGCFSDSKSSKIQFVQQIQNAQGG